MFCTSPPYFCFTLRRGCGFLGMGDSDGMAGRRAHSHVCVLERHDAKSLRAGPRQTRRARVNRSVRHGRRYASTSYIALGRRPHTPSSFLILSMGIAIVTSNIITAYPPLLLWPAPSLLTLRQRGPLRCIRTRACLLACLRSVWERERARERSAAIYEHTAVRMCMGR